MTKSQILEAVLQAIPYPDQIKDIDMESRTSSVKFAWRGDVFVVGDTLNVDCLEDGCLCGNNISIIFRELLKKTKFIREL
jgi:hypothetical protein